MLCVLFLVFLISGGLTQDSELEEDLIAERYNYTCIVPPSDKIRNGRFRVEGYDDDEQPRAGKKLYSYVLKVTCNPGYTMKGWFLVQCVTENNYMEEFPECLPTCKRSSPDVFSCGSGFGNDEARCIAPRNLAAEISTRASPLQCGKTPNVFKPAVVNGRAANREEVPWHAGVYTKTTSPYMQICGGTIISENVVISAAHCFWNDVEKKLPAENYAVAVGKLYRPWDAAKDSAAQKLDVEEIRIPPRFQGSATNFQDDIALLMLAAPFITLSDYITPACLDFNHDFDERQLALGKLGRVGGWGLDSEDGPSSQVLNVVELPIVSIEQCIAGAEPGFISSITSDKICAGYTNGTAVCKGDSGGGLVVREVVDVIKTYYLRGIVSTAPRSDHLCNIYAVATFTHVAKHEHFIMAAINQPLANEAPKTTPIPTTFPTIIKDTTKAVDIAVTENSISTEAITKNAADKLQTGDDSDFEETTKDTAGTNVFKDKVIVEDATKYAPSGTILTENDTDFAVTTKNTPTSFVTIVEDTKKTIDSEADSDINDTETTTEYREWKEFLKLDNYIEPPLPLPLTNLNSTHSKEKRNNSITTSNRDVNFLKIDSNVAKIPHINDMTETDDLEPITNPPLNSNQNYDQNIKDINLNTSEQQNIEDIKGIDLDLNKKDDNEEENISVSPEISFQTNFNQNPETETIKQSPEDTNRVSNANINDNIAKIPASGVPIAISIGETYEIVNSNPNVDTLPEEKVSFEDTDTLNANTNDKLATTPSPIEAVDVNEGQIFQTVKPKVSPSTIPIGTNIEIINTNEEPVTVKESSQNDGSITIWPTVPPVVDIKPVGSNQDSIPSNEAQTPAILEDHWVTACPECEYETPGNFHHHWQHRSWHKQENGQNPHQDWHRHPNWQNSQQNHPDWRKQSNWQHWNPTGWQQKRFHPFVEYHQGFLQQPPKPAPNYGPWFGRFRK